VTWFGWLSLAGVCLLGAMSPGPSLALVVSQTLRGGRSQGIACGIGHGLGVAFYAVAVVSGLAVVITTSPLLFDALRWGGAGCLLYLGIMSLRAAPAAANEAIAAPDPAPRGAFWRGFAIAFLNPKLAVFFLAVFSQFLRPEAALLEKVLMVATVGGIDALWYSAVSIALDRDNIVARLRRSEILLNRLFGFILIALAVRVVLT
jgi:threonine/homoserine/homoserine lactone efflux protein